MFVFVLFLVLALGAGGWFAWKDPARARAVADQARERLVASGAQARESARELTPKLIGDRVVRAVVQSAWQMPDGSRYVRSCVHVEIPAEVVEEFGAQLVGALQDQCRAKVDEELRRRGWRTTEPTSVSIVGASDLPRHELRIQLVGGSETVVTGPAATAGTAAGPTTGRVGAARPGFVAGDGTTYALPEFGDATVGRAPTCTVVLPAHLELISRHHLRLVMGSGQPLLKDTSANGTWVNGVRVSGSVVLQDGDTVGFAGPNDHALVFHRAVPAKAAR